MTKILLSCLCLLFLSQFVNAWAQDPTIAPDVQESESMLENRRVYSLIKQNGLQNIEDEDLESRIEFQSKDPYFHKLTQGEFEELKKSSLSELGSTGFAVCLQESGEIKLIGELKKDIANQSGLMVGDVITEINGNRLQNLSRNEVEELFFSPPGSVLEMNVWRSSRNINVITKLAHVPKVTVVGQLIYPGIAYLKVSRFLAHTGRELMENIDRVKTILGQDIDAYIVDLRGNPGGSLAAAVESADLFMSKGVIASTVNQQGQVQSLYTAHDSSLEAEASKKIIVLIDRDTASAAELFAAALQDNSRALIVGRNSYGKDTVQDYFELEYGEAIKLTTAKYLTPRGCSVYKTGIRPDVFVDRPSVITSIVNSFRSTDKKVLSICDQRDELTDLNDKDIALAIKLLHLSPLIFKSRAESR